MQSIGNVDWFRILHEQATIIEKRILSASSLMKPPALRSAGWSRTILPRQVLHSPMSPRSPVR